MQATTDSKKYDQGKLRWHLLPLPLIEEVVRVYKFGANKYGENNWQTLDGGYDRWKAAMFRHLVSYEKGQVFDEESGIHHLAHVAWNALAMLHCAQRTLGKGLRDDVFEMLKKCEVVTSIVGKRVKFALEDDVCIGTVVQENRTSNGKSFEIETESFSAIVRDKDIIEIYD